MSSVARRAPASSKRQPNLYASWDALRQLDDASDPGVHITLAPHLPEQCEGWLSRAMPRREPIDLARILERTGDARDLRIGCRWQMKSAHHQGYSRIYRSGRFHDLFDARMRAARDDYHTLLGFDRQGQFPQFARTGLV